MTEKKKGARKESAFFISKQLKVPQNISNIVIHDRPKLEKDSDECPNARWAMEAKPTKKKATRIR